MGEGESKRLGDVTVGEVQFGFEITGTTGAAGFTTNSFALSYS